MALRSRVLAGLILALLHVGCKPKPAPLTIQRQRPQSPPDAPPPPSAEADEAAQTKVLMHNVLLRKGPILKVRIKWLRGSLQPTHPGVEVSLDDVTSFNIHAQDGELSATLDELAQCVSQAGVANGALSGIRLFNDAGKLRLQAKYHKIFPIRVEGDVTPFSDDRLRIHIAKISLLQVPVKGLLHILHLKAADLLDARHSKGLEVKDDDIYADLAQLLPPPHINGSMTSVHVVGHSLLATFGNSHPEVVKHEEWRNYLRLRGGTLQFGKLQMSDADMIMIDTSADEWFDLDLDHYQQQMVYGYSRITPDAGLQIFMPGVETIAGLKKPLNLEWVKHRNQTPPADVLPH